MFDPLARRVLDPTLNHIAGSIAIRGITANKMTMLGSCIIPLIVAAILYEAWFLALSLILLNRLIDGLDGAVARIGNHATPWGGYC
ncbi:MAG: CDP-alcohol phosphatidyltransferase family protein, partial [Pseudomonadota bacterium]